MNGKILIVDDNGKKIQLLANLLTSADYGVEYALGGESALEWLGKEYFDAILLDIMMPEMDGFQTCNAIKALPGGENIPILFITARDDAESINKAFRTGGVDYITKPFNQDELLARLGTHVELRRSKEKLMNTAAWLEKEVDNKTKALQEANVRIEKSFNELKTLDLAQNEFLKSISHEIRTPLNGIVGSISLLKGYTDNDDLTEVVSLLEKSVDKLEHYSMTALQIAYLRLKGVNQLSMQEINLNAIVKNCISNVLDKSDGKGIKIRFKTNCPGVTVTGDHDMLNNSFKALIDSCITYSIDGTIDVEVAKSGEEIVCTISDEGAPFVNDKPMYLFDSINNKSAAYERNTNMELHFAQMVVLTHGWDLLFRNKVSGKGTDTVIVIPLAKGPKAKG